LTHTPRGAVCHRRSNSEVTSRWRHRWLRQQVCHCSTCTSHYSLSGADSAKPRATRLSRSWVRGRLRPVGTFRPCRALAAQPGGPPDRRPSNARWSSSVSGPEHRCRARVERHPPAAPQRRCLEGRARRGLPGKLQRHPLPRAPTPCPHLAATNIGTAPFFPCLRVPPSVFRVSGRTSQNILLLNPCVCVFLVFRRFGRGTA
jgi:hypothetical protein